MDADTKNVDLKEAFGDCRPPNASCTIQGNCLEYKVHEKFNMLTGSKRGSISDFSPRARLTMLKTFQKIDFENHLEPLFITLTYPDERAMPTLEERNIHRKVIARHLERIIDQPMPAAWRIEWMPRQTGTMIGQICPHWHLLVFGVRFIPWQALREAWCQTIGHDGYCRTDIRRVDRRGAIQMYMAKYISKEAVSCSLVIATYQNKIGRQYGWLRKKLIPMHPVHAYGTLTDRDRDTLTSLAAERLPWLSERREQSFTLFGTIAQDAQKILTGEALDE